MQRPRPEPVRTTSPGKTQEGNASPGDARNPIDSGAATSLEVADLVADLRSFVTVAAVSVRRAVVIIGMLGLGPLYVDELLVGLRGAAELDGDHLRSLLDDIEEMS